MALKGIKDTEKVAVGAIRTAIQTWLAPQLNGISERLARAEEPLEGMDRDRATIDERINGFRSEMNSFRNEMGSFRNKMNSFRIEMRAELATVHREIKRIDVVADLRERLASVEAKLAAHQG